MPNKADETLQSTGSNRDTTLGLGEPEDRTLSGDVDVKVDDKLAAASEGNAVDRANDWLAATLVRLLYAKPDSGV